MLPVNFHRTFVPERRLIGALLHYAALGKQGNYQEIAEETGIPMGRSSGKVPSVIDYARGMGLIELAGAAREAVKRPVLTPMGRAVYSEDKYLGEELTQWLAHMNLCRGDIGAETWHAAFAKGRSALGSTFTRQQLENYLEVKLGPGNNRTGPMVRTYTDEAALARAGILADLGDRLERRKAPILDAYASPYSAVILTLVEEFFPGQTQVTLSDFNDKTLWFDICLCSPADVERVFSVVERKGYVAVDRQMRPWILDKRALAGEVWPRIFEDMA